MAYLKQSNYIQPILSIKEFYEKRNKVLLFHDKGGLGDVLMHRMLVNDMKKNLPDVSFTVACLPEYIDATIDHPFIDSVVDSRNVNNQDYIITFNTCVSVADRYENKNAPYYNDHRSDIWAKYCGLELSDHDMNFSIDNKRIERIKDQLNNFKNKSGALIGLAPISKMANKSLLPDQIKCIANFCKDHNLIVLHNRPLSICEKYNLPIFSTANLQDWLASIYCMDYMITVDTAAFHASGGLKKPLTGIFTFANGKTYGKYYDFILVQKHRDNGNWDCGPCFVFGNCPKSKKAIKPCLSELSCDEIINGLQKMFDKWPYKVENKTL